ncbi:hypothetical protein GF359_06080 [candidate division WOR-3 bacterium]|uniref:Outer membrane protein beta-barrel domain-containing protein n=1 Tax=candidate division WOR-3 bacterium TaxID=2052148 RepID=A0A9D5QD58_UNCW3|nr:hypothetical protein [candidate division WOR-3 bacterium]MBD3364767.1 hypothetical protein [candidate division WOR-3 bacterium]
MRKIIVLVILGLTAMTAAPFNTLPAYTIPRGSGFVGLTTPVQVPFQGSFSAIPTLWAGYGVIPHFDVTLMLGADVTVNGFSLSDAMIEFRYATLGYEDVVARDHFVFAPVLDFYIPTGTDGSWAVGPGALVTGNFGFWQLHGNLFTYFPFDSPGMIIGFFSPELPLGGDFSVYAELNAFFDLGASELFCEFWPGVCWEPRDWFSANLACGIPATFDYVSPGIAAYVMF